VRYLKHAALSAATGLAALLACSSPASAAALAGGDGPGDAEIIRLVARQTQGQFVDVDGPGPTQGDEFVLTGNLFRGATQVGTYSQICTLTRTAPADEFDLQCAGDLAFPMGQITVQGRFNVTSAGPGDTQLAITGGTGYFRTAHGFIRSVNVSDTESLLTIHLIR
jgi:hypothetical protein